MEPRASPFSTKKCATPSSTSWSPCPGAAQLVQTPTNVQRIRNSGVEVAFQKDNFGFRGLEVLGSATWLNARVISDPTWAPSTVEFRVPLGDVGRRQDCAERS